MLRTKHNTSRRQPQLIAITALVLAFAAHAAAQSTDLKSPTPLTASEISGGEIAERSSYYFSFEGGPGEVTAALEAKIKKGVKGAGVGVEIFDANAKSLASALVSGGLDAGKDRIESELFKQLGRITSAADSIGGGDTKQKTARVKVKTRQPLVLKLTVDKGVESFTLRMGGAFGAADIGYTAPADASQTYPAAETLTQSEETTPADPAVSTEQSAPAEETPQGEQTPAADTTSPTNVPKAKLVGVILGRRPALLKIPGKKPAQQLVPPQPTGEKPALVMIPGKKPAPKQAPQQVPPQPTGQKPGFIKIPGKKQP